MLGKKPLNIIAIDKLIFSDPPDTEALSAIKTYIEGRQKSVVANKDATEYPTAMLKRLFNLAKEPAPVEIAASNEAREIYDCAEVDRLLFMARAWANIRPT